MRPFYVFFAARCLFFMQMSAVGAQTTIDSTQCLDELVITAHRSAKTRFQTPDAVDVLALKTMRSLQARTAPEALSALSGVFVQKTNHGSGSPFLRGLTGNQTLLLVDGIRLNNATFRYGPNQYFNTIDPFSIDKVEVLRGGGSVQYGSDALGGTLQAQTRALSFSEQSRLGGQVLVRGATQNMEKTLRVEGEYSHQKIALAGGITGRKFGDLVGGDTTGRQTPSGYQELNFDIKGQIALSAKSTLTFAHQNVHQCAVPVFHKVQLEQFALNQFEPQRRVLTYVRLDQSIHRGIWKTLSITSAWHQTEEGRESRKNGSSVLKSEQDRVRSLRFIAQINQVFNQYWSANSGLEIYHDWVNSDRFDTNLNTLIATEKRGLYPNASTMTSLAAFSLHEWNVQKWQFTAGMRWNSFLITVEEEAIGEVRIQPSALVWNAASMRRLGPYSNLFLSVNTGFRAPNVDDLGTLGIVDFRFETPNYSLQPEHSTQYQLGYKWQSNRLQGEVYVYRNELRNLITRIQQDTQQMQGYPLYQKENTVCAYIQGLETAWRYGFAQNWAFLGTVTYTYGQNSTAHEPLRRIPPLFTRFVLDYSPRNWSFQAEWLSAGKQDRLAKGDTEDNRIPTGGTPAWKLLNWHVGHAWSHFSVRVSALNLFDEDYRTHGSGVNGVGRSVFGTMAIRF